MRVLVTPVASFGTIEDAVMIGVHLVKPGGSPL
jgi:hypothetical protein